MNRGHPQYIIVVIIAIVFASCPCLCPVTVSANGRLVQTLPEFKQKTHASYHYSVYICTYILYNL